MEASTRFATAENLKSGDYFIVDTNPNTLYIVASEGVSVAGNHVHVDTYAGSLVLNNEQEVLVIDKVEKVPFSDLMDGGFVRHNNEYVILGSQVHRLLSVNTEGALILGQDGTDNRSRAWASTFHMFRSN